MKYYNITNTIIAVLLTVCLAMSIHIAIEDNTEITIGKRIHLEKSDTNYCHIGIKGDSLFCIRTIKAFKLLENTSYNYYINYLNGIIQTKGSSGVCENCKVFYINNELSSSDIKYLASAIAHDTYYCVLYERNEVFNGKEVELECNAYQLLILYQLKADKYLIDYIYNQDGNHYKK